uniref:C-type lectin domain family 17, member A-like n=1 Tax=Ciona intestinalis TaxID=7719 RepID=UPI000EF507C7|nr:C-type lectin domain family 17, member A-like [Ciona intestinalis]|eukprot:XP_026695561.1 C-type lectin domain family 17, member A-like [Ciona intestinalis]
MNDRASESNWVWTDGTPSNYYNWKYNQPSQDGDCMRIVGIDDDDAWGTWNDRGCGEDGYPICEVSAGEGCAVLPSEKFAVLPREKSQSLQCCQKNKFVKKLWCCRFKLCCVA